jgi:hypothetical protein
MATAVSNHNVKIEYCDHLPGAHPYDILLQLGQDRALQLCQQCGKAFQSDVMEHLLGQAVNNYASLLLRRCGSV